MPDISNEPAPYVAPGDDPIPQPLPWQRLPLDPFDTGVDAGFGASPETEDPGAARTGGPPGV